MLAAVLTSILFALSGVTGRSAGASFGALEANLYRLGIALVLLGGLWGLLGTAGWAAPGAGLAWLAVSGLVGFGFGDVMLYLSYGYLGSRRTILTVFTTAPAVAALTEWLWLGERMGGLELGAAGVVVAGLVLVFLPSGDGAGEPGHPRHWGVIIAVLAGVGQGLGAVLTRKANLAGGVGEGFGGGIGQACVRVAAGAVVALLALHWARRVGWRRPPGRDLHPPRRRAWLILVGAGIFGPVLGVSCFQWSLFQLPSGITLAVVASSPLVIIPFSWWLEGDRPSARALVGTGIAVAGVAWLCLLRA